MADGEILGRVVVDVDFDDNALRARIKAATAAPFQVQIAFNKAQIGAALKAASVGLTVKADVQFSRIQMQKELAEKAALLKPVKIPVTFDVNRTQVAKARKEFQILQNQLTDVERKEQLKRDSTREKFRQKEALASARETNRIRSDAEKRTRLEFQSAERIDRQRAAFRNSQLLGQQRLNNTLIAQATRTQAKLATLSDRPLFLRAGEGLQNISNSLSTFDRTASRVLRTSLVAFTAWSAGVTLAVGAVAAIAITSFAKLQDATSRASAVVASSRISDEIVKTGKQLSNFASLATAAQKQIADTAAKVALKTIFNPKEVAEGIKALLQAGQDLPSALQNISSAANFATITNTDLTTSADLLASGLASAGLASKDSALLLDKFAFVAQTSLGEASDVAEAFANRGASAFKAYGRGVDETLTLISLLAQTGTTGKPGGTQASIVLRDIAKAAGKNAPEFRKYGIAVRDADHLNVSFNETLLDLANVFGRVRDERGDLGIASLRKELGFMDRSVGSILQIVPQVEKLGAKGLDNITKGIKSSAGTVQRQADFIRRNISFQFGNLLDSFTVAFNKFGEAASGNVTKLFDRFAGSGGLIEQATPRIEEFGRRFGALIGRIADFVQTDDFANGIKILVDSIRITLRGVADSIRHRPGVRWSKRGRKRFRCFCQNNTSVFRVSC